MTAIDIVFPADGSIGPRPGASWYQGYQLFSAISTALSWAHSVDGVGFLWEPGALTVRCPADLEAAMRRLAGRRLDVAGRPLVLGAPVVQPLVTSPSLASPFVTATSSETKRCMGASDLAAHIFRQLDQSGTSGGAEHRVEVMHSHIEFKVSTRRVFGFAVELHDLTEEQSIYVQEHGLGGRRRMGAGLFFPCPKRAA